MAMGDSTGTNSVASGAAERALLDYFDGLLHDDGGPVAAPLRDIAVDAVRESAMAAVGNNVRPLVNANSNARAVRPVRIVEAVQTFAEPLPFAEPVRPLRMPLPPIAPPEPVIAPVDVVAKAPVDVPVQAPVVAPSIPSPITAPPKTPVAPPAVEAVDPVLDSNAEADIAAPPNWAANGRPQWAQQPFECLLFKSGGLTLAVPLVELGSIYPLEEDDISGIFGQIEWFLGLMRTKYGNLRVVDTARVVMPERYRDDMAAGYQFVLSLSHSDWGLGIDAIDGTTLLDPEAVRWRSERSKRPWLAGTVVEKMCALLDVAQMRWMFDQLDRKRAAPPA
jgi:purine-binding chemotaxis protein CheW